MVSTVTIPLQRRSAKPLEVFGLEYSRAGATDSGSRIDRERKVIYGVKIAGLESVNTARMLGCPESWGSEALDSTYGYTEDCLRQAVESGLYEGVRVYTNHAETRIDAKQQRVITGGDRLIGDHFGRLVNTRFVPGEGIRGDLEYLESHHDCAKILETVDRMPEQIALSHSVRMVPTLQGGRVVISKIRQVRSVDLIAERPGTTHSIFESGPMIPPNGLPKTDATGVEDDGMDPAAAPAGAGPAPKVEAPEEGKADPEALVREGLIAGASAIISDKGTAAEKIAKLTPLLEQMDVLSGLLSGKPAEKPAAESATPGKAAQTERDAVETAAQNELIQLRAKDKARDALESAGVKASPSRLAILSGLTDENQKLLIEEYKKADAVPAQESGGRRPMPPRSGGSGAAPTGAKLTARSPKEFVAAINSDDDEDE